MDEKVKVFLDKWNEMLDAATDIKEFTYAFQVEVRSDVQHINSREDLIRGVNRSFSEHGMRYSSRTES